MSYQVLILLIFAGFAFAEILSARFFKMDGETKSDKWVEIISTLTLMVVVQPLVLFSAIYITAALFPDAKDILVGSSIFLLIGLLVIGDDMLQYWWHRASHTFPFLYGLHRAHHNGNYMSIRIVYRNNILYYAFMPSLWVSGVLVYMGAGEVYVYYIVVKLSVIFGAHSNVRWDAKLLKAQWFSPIMWVIERTISTPATHAAHHGKYSSDPATHYKGNFGNLFFFWDVIFGTAKITREYPKEYGVENLAPMSGKAQLLWPILQDDVSPTAETVSPSTLESYKSPAE